MTKRSPYCCFKTVCRQGFWAIARALDIAEVRIEPLANLEGALITTPERNTGAILLNSRTNPRRRRFTLGHELGHFLNPWHQPAAPDGFHCSREGMLTSDGRSKDRYLRQEAGHGWATTATPTRC